MNASIKSKVCDLKGYFRKKTSFFINSQSIIKQFIIMSNMIQVKMERIDELKKIIIIYPKLMNSFTTKTESQNTIACLLLLISNTENLMQSAYTILIP